MLRRLDPLLVAPLIVIAMTGAAAALDAAWPGLYYRVVQEDGALEWATFWSFLAAGVSFVASALRLPWRERWFPLGLGLFCALVAFEEISWGQRLLGLQPPETFLAHNAQQELNLHNLVDDDLRQNGFLVVCLGYGVGLALAARSRAVATLVERLGLRAPPLALTPAFAVAGVLYVAYPWRFTGEWTEWMLGVCFLADAIDLRSRSHAASTRGKAARARRAAAIAAAFVACWAAGWGTAVVAGVVQQGDPALREVALRELEAMRLDFSDPRARTSCGLHRRVYAFAEGNDGEYLHDGVFARAAGPSGSAERARFFVDPWGSAYWIRHKCNSAHTHRSVFVYSLGPNRRRDSSRWVVGGDDIGVHVKGTHFTEEPDFDE